MVKKKNTKEKKSSPISAITSKEMDDFGRKLLMVLVGILVAYAIIYIGTLVRNNVKEHKFIGQEPKTERTLSVSATGEVEAKPDVAETTIGVTFSSSTVKKAQDKNTKIINNLISKLKELGIEEKDIQTANYNVYPNYNYTSDEGRALEGYKVSQSVEVKIRDLSKASKVLGLAGEVGANDVGGLQFDIEKPEELESQARQESISKAKEKAQRLADNLGVEIVGVVSYSENKQGEMRPIYKESLGHGGSADSPKPQIESGSQDVKITSNVEFEIENK
jgi:uncharacterized protein YggE